MKTILLFLPLRITASLLICALTAMAFMRVAGGAAMFCIEPPAADPGWEWKVPAAWVIIYSISTFLAVAVSSVRPKAMLVPILVACVTVGAFIALRYLQVSGTTFPYFGETEAHWGIPAMLIAAALACVTAYFTRKPASR